ncbi:response regulator transcription factor [Bacillus paranthracis]|uniref:response regulator transcription factor n=1 Tax=Bacillus paranthracis TaxID=2026186 RepID=UPI003D65ED12
MYKILLLEDEHEIGSTLEMILKSENYHVDWFTTGVEAVNAAIANKYDLMILDVMLKTTAAGLNSRISNGLEVARLVNQNKKVPYLLLTSRNEPLDIMQGLDMGAEDYITKPYDLTVLLARIRTVLRRTSTEEHSNGGVTQCGNIEINLLTHKVTVDGKQVHLTNQLFELLHYFVAHKGKIISKEELYKNIWGYDPSELQETNTLEVNIRRLRNSIGIDIIKTVRGKGYVLEVFNS